MMRWTLRRNSLKLSLDQLHKLTKPENKPRLHRALDTMPDDEVLKLFLALARLEDHCLYMGNK